MVEVKVSDDLIYIEKKFLTLGAQAMEKPEETVEDKPKDLLIDEDEDEDDNFSFDIEDDVEDDEEGEDEDDEDEDDEDDEEETISIEDIEDTEVTSPFSSDDNAAPKSDLEMLRAKLQKSLAELEDIKSDMSNTFTSTDTIGTTITSLRGMLDAIKKDQMNLLSKR